MAALLLAGLRKRPGWRRPLTAASSRGIQPARCRKVRARGLVAARVERPTQNWYGQGESDCLIKTKHCEGVKTC